MLRPGARATAVGRGGDRRRARRRDLHRDAPQEPRLTPSCRSAATAIARWRICSTTRRSDAGLRCGPLSVPNHKLIPEARWLLKAGKNGVLARSDAASAKRIAPRRRDLTDRPHAFVIEQLADPTVRHDDRRARTGAACRGSRASRPTRYYAAVMPRCLTRGGAWQHRGAVALARAARRGVRCCASGASSTGCPTPTTPTRTRTSSRSAIGLFGHGWNPHYFVNPPAYTYLLQSLFDVWFGGRDGGLARASRPTRPRSSSLARVAAASLGTLAVWLLYLAGRAAVRPPRRRCSRRRCWRSRSCRSSTRTSRSTTSRRSRRSACRCGARPASLRNGAPARLRARGRRRSAWRARRSTPAGSCCCRCSAAVAVQLAAPGGARRALRAASRSRRRAGAASAFFVANPYALLDCSAFRDGLDAPADGCRRRAGQARARRSDNGVVYYLWTFTWGLGWVPAARGARRRRRALAAATGALLAGARAGAGRCSCSSWARRSATSGAGCCRSSRSCACSPRYAALRARRRARRAAGRRCAPTLLALGGRSRCCAAGARLLAPRRPRALARRHAQPGARLDGRQRPARTQDRRRAGRRPTRWAQDLGHPSALTANGNRWSKFPTSRRTSARRAGEPLKVGAAGREHRGLRAHAARRR